MNTKYLVLIENVRVKQHFLCLARQIHPAGPNKLFKQYLKATKIPHGYLVLDLVQDTNDRIRFRTHIFPKEYPRIFYVDVKDDETDKVELSLP